MPEATGPRRVLRVALLLAALACAGGAARLAARDGLPGPPFLERHAELRPDPRPLTPDEAATLAHRLAGQRRDDALLLLAGLAAGCLAVAARPALARPAGVLAAVLATGSVALGLHAAARSLAAQASDAAAGRWTVGDDALDALAGGHAGALRELRARIAEDEAVLLVGTDQVLFNAAAWALHPRALFPLVQDVPAGMDAAQLREFARRLPQGAGFARRWLLDLGALAQGAAAGREALLDVPP